MSIMDVLSSLNSMSLLRSLHMGLIPRIAMATSYIRSFILLMFPTCTCIRAIDTTSSGQTKGRRVDVMIIVRRSSAALMLALDLGVSCPESCQGDDAVWLVSVDVGVSVLAWDMRTSVVWILLLGGVGGSQGAGRTGVRRDR